jgi:hypothetical protein
MTTSPCTWDDQRTGALGRLVGSTVLDKIRRETGQEIVRTKGTIFESANSIFVSRLNVNPGTSGGVLHVSPLKLDVLRKLSGSRKALKCLFISLIGNQVHYWLIPAHIVAKAVAGRPVESCEGSTLIRIREDRGRHMLEGTAVSRYHREMSVHPNRLRAVSQETRRAADPQRVRKNVSPSECVFLPQRKRRLPPALSF